MKHTISKALKQKISALIKDGVWDLPEVPRLQVERPKDFSHGDYTVNVGFVLAKPLSMSPAEITTKVVQDLIIDGIDEIVSVGGYINFTLSQQKKVSIIEDVLTKAQDYGKSDTYAGKKIMVEYTDPNPFKVFHIGHLMTNTIGESLAGILEFSGAQVIRANYQGDVGRHVAMAVWGMDKNSVNMPDEKASLDEKTQFLGQCYVEGSKAFEKSETAKQEIIAINKAIYEKSDENLNTLYTIGRAWSLEKFEQIYKLLGTKFDEYFFESETWKVGMDIVTRNTPGIFEESQGAVIFDGEKFDLHKRVFINSQGLTTYEAKDVGLAHCKKKRHDCDTYLTVTAVEQNLYFGVVFKAIELAEPYFAGRLQNVAHGLLQLKSGKMSSRTGKVISGTDLIEQAQQIAQDKISQKNGSDASDEIVDMIAVAGIKFNILKQALGKNIVYDPSEALSFEGDSGPYLQYTYVRTHSVLAKAKKLDLSAKAAHSKQNEELVYLISLFPEIITRSAEQKAPHLIANYLLDVAHAYNAFYAKHKIIDKHSRQTYSRIALTQAVNHVMRNGLYVLGIKAPQTM